MNKPAILFILALLAVPAFAVDCTKNYNACMTQCCNTCGSTLSNSSNGTLACNVGTMDSPKQECVLACMPCTDSYITCIASQGGVALSTSGTGCCGSAFVLLAGLGFAIRGRI